MARAYSAGSQNVNWANEKVQDDEEVFSNYLYACLCDPVHHQPGSRRPIRDCHRGHCAFNRACGGGRYCTEAGHYVRFCDMKAVDYVETARLQAGKMRDAAENNSELMPRHGK